MNPDNRLNSVPSPAETAAQQVLIDLLAEGRLRREIGVEGLLRTTVYYIATPSPAAEMVNWQ